MVQLVAPWLLARPSVFLALLPVDCSDAKRHCMGQLRYGDKPALGHECGEGGGVGADDGDVGLVVVLVQM